MICNRCSYDEVLSLKFSHRIIGLDRIWLRYSHIVFSTNEIWPRQQAFYYHWYAVLESQLCVIVLPIKLLRALEWKNWGLVAFTISIAVFVWCQICKGKFHIDIPFYFKHSFIIPLIYLDTHIVWLLFMKLSKMGPRKLHWQPKYQWLGLNKYENGPQAPEK